MAFWKSRRVRLWQQVLRQTFSSWYDRDAMTHGAAVAFFALFSLAPVLILVVTIAGLAFGQEAVRGQLVRQFGQLMGRDQALAVEHILRSAAMDQSGVFARVVGVIAFAIGTTSVFVQLQSSLNLMWDVTPKPGPLIRTLLLKRLTSFALVIAIGFLLLVSLALSAAISGLQEYLQPRMDIPAPALGVANLLLSLAVFTVLFAMIFRILPDVEIPWRDVWFGAFMTSALLSIGKWAIGLYLGRTAVASTYGAAASVIIIVFWVYYTSLLVLLGAIFTRVYSRQFLGSHRTASEGATRVHCVREELPER